MKDELRAETSVGSMAVSSVASWVDPLAGDSAAHLVVKKVVSLAAQMAAPWAASTAEH